MASFLNYKISMIIKRLLFGACLGVLLVGCVPASVSVPTLTPGSTLSPVITPSDTTLPTFTLSPTPTPEVRVETGEKALFNGDYDQALIEYQAAFDNSTNPDVRSAALWGLGRVEYAIKNNAAALETLWQLTSKYPASPNAIPRIF